ncbi:MAG TPA: hypothetical protein VGH42_11615 [Verrucomicrobiae bacterium]
MKQKLLHHCLVGVILLLALHVQQVFAQFGKPTIIGQPSSQTATLGSNITFSVFAFGSGTLSYRWLLNGTNLLTPRIITTVAGDGAILYDGDGKTATTLNVNAFNVALDANGILFIADSSNTRVRKVDANGIMTVVAGKSFTQNYGGDGGQATNASINYPYGVAFDAIGSMFIADNGNNRIRKVDTNGIITTVAGIGAGNGAQNISGDGGSATNAVVSWPWDVTADAQGNYYIADYGNRLIRKVDTNGIITTVAGNGTYGYSGDGGAATNATMTSPHRILVDATGNLFISDYSNNRIRKVDTNGIITTVAGNGTAGYSGDGGAATNAALHWPYGVAEDMAGNLFIADSQNNVIRKVDTNGIITTEVGTGTQGFSGDGGAPTNAMLNNVYGVAVSAAGNLFIADYGNARVRKVGRIQITAPTFSLTNVTTGYMGNYSVIVSNSFGSVTSSIASLSLQLPPVVPVLAPTNGIINFTWSTIPNLTYQLQFTTNLSSGNWINLGDSITATNGSITTSDSGITDVQRFYRVQLVQ